MAIVRTAIAAANLTVAVVGIAITMSRHPAVRAGLRAAPHLMTPQMRDAAAGVAMGAAYRAGVVARRIVPRGISG